jgi:hypothetical protein
VAGLLHELARNLVCVKGALEVARVVIGKLGGLDAGFEVQAAFFDELVGERREVVDLCRKRAGCGQIGRAAG